MYLFPFFFYLYIVIYYIYLAYYLLRPSFGTFGVRTQDPSNFGAKRTSMPEPTSSSAEWKPASGEWP
ncbi:hypothetical protein BDV30DRAFT_221545 [Aspergillus minisclerotigenes]|uniref:Uncharacterized protein n=1 Tax=Aspergillus minisclerotigenes TaxID=656917 RepID=A0A5N6ILB5_9EURO|nr:hypothetical protein BDV30DRAFT_221545 [Aspergillus minisclerotigenes]